MNETAELAAALAAVQAELPAVTKNRTADVKNKDGVKLYSYSYADLADVSAAVMPILGKHGLAFTAFPGHQQDGKFGLRYYLLHSSGGRLEGFFEIDDKGGMQLVGGRITYARRYTLCAVTGITADEDVDAREDNGNSRTVQRRTQPQRPKSSPPAQAARPPAAVSAPRADAGGDLPPLPGDGRPGDEQRGKLVGMAQQHFKRLGYGDEDKPQRLTDAARLARVSGISSLNDLNPDELTVVVGELAKCRNRDALRAVLAKLDGSRGEEVPSA